MNVAITYGPPLFFYLAVSSNLRFRRADKSNQTLTGLSFMLCSPPTSWASWLSIGLACGRTSRNFCS